jgi:PST family polysaccharide transporter
VNLLKTSFYTAISTAITFISGFVLIKVIAVKIGPEGIAQVGQFQNTTALLSIAATASISVGVTKYLAEYQNDLYKKQQLISTAIITVIIAALSVGLFVIGFSSVLSSKAFHRADYSIVYILFGSFLILISLNTLFASILNGLKEIKKLTIVNSAGALGGIIVTFLFADLLGVKGVLIAANFTAIILFSLNVFLFKKMNYISLRLVFSSFNKKILVLLLSFSLMNIASGILAPVSQLSIRGFIIKKFTLEEAGYWQAITRISDYYLTFITTVLSVYYLPRLSELVSRHEIKEELKKGYKIILPSTILLALIIFLSKGLIIRVLFTESFMPMEKLFHWQLIGDVLKIGSWLLAYLMLAKAKIKTLIVTEIIFTFSLIAFTKFGVTQFGLIGATYAFALNYGLYWITMIFLMRKYLWISSGDKL